MERVTELRVRADWGIIRLIYLPLLVVGLAAIRVLPWVAVISIRAWPCGICMLLARWFNHLDESISGKPILQITGRGITYEDGGEPTEYGWAEIIGVVMHRRNNIPPWRTDGSTEITPPFWLAISVRDSDYKQPEAAELAGESYAERSRRPDDGWEIDAEGTRTICIWPRQVVGGLFSLMRFAKELQRCLVELCERGEIDCMVPTVERMME